MRVRFSHDAVCSFSVVTNRKVYIATVCMNIMKKLLTTIATAGILAFAGCDSRPEPDRTVKDGRLQSGMRYFTYVAPGRAGEYERVISFCDGMNVRTIEYTGKEKIAGDFLQTYDITQDGKYVLEDGEFKGFITSPGSNRAHWREIAVGNSQLRLEAINDANEVLHQLGINRVLEEGSPSITEALERKAGSK